MKDAYDISKDQLTYVQINVKDYGTIFPAHGGVMDVLYRAATRLDLQAPRTWYLPNCAINRLLWTPEGLTLIGWGDTRHLEALEGAPLQDSSVR